MVLAGGRATRFGATKQLAPLAGRPLVLHAVTAATTAGLDPVLVVLGHEADAVRAVLPDHVVAVDNPRFAAGQSTSLRAGVDAAAATDAAALLVLLADEPDVAATAIGGAVRAWREGAVVVRTRYDDRPGHPVLFDRSSWALLRTSTGDTGARDLLAGLPVTWVEHAGPAPHDVDRPRDLHAVASGDDA